MPEFNFETIQTLEAQAMEAAKKRKELQDALEMLMAQRDQIAAEINFYTGSAAGLTQTAEKMLADAGLTTKDYVSWKELHNAPGNQTTH